MLASITNINFNNRKQINPVKKNFKTNFDLQNIQNDSFSKSNNVSFGNFYQELFKKNQIQILSKFVETSDDDYILLSLISSEMNDKTKTIKSLQKKLFVMEHSPHKIDFRKHINIFNTVENKLKPYFEWEENYRSFVKLCITSKKFSFLTDEQMKVFYKKLYAKPPEIEKLKPLAAYYKSIKNNMEEEGFECKPLADIGAIKEAQLFIDNLKSAIPVEDARFFLYKLTHFQPQNMATPEFEKLTEESSELYKKINNYNLRKNEINQKIQEFKMPFDMKDVEKSFNEQYEHNKKILFKYAHNLFNYVQDNNIHLHHKTSRITRNMLSRQKETNELIKAKFDDFINNFYLNNSQT